MSPTRPRLASFATVLAVLTLMLVMALLASTRPAAGQDRTNPGVRAQESCKLDAAYNVLLDRVPDRSGHNYWQSVLRQRFANGNQIIEWHVPAGREYLTVRADTTVIQHIHRMLSWSRGEVNPATANWYLRSSMSRPQMLAYETSYHGRCDTARRTGRYIPHVQL